MSFTSDRAADVLASAREISQTFTARNEIMRRAVDLVERRSEVAVPLAYEKTAVKFRSHLPFQQTAAVTAALSVNPLGVQREPIGRGDTAQKLANTIERWAEAGWAKQNADNLLVRSTVHSQVVKGAAVIKSVPRHQTYWAQYYRDAVDYYGGLKKAMDKPLSYRERNKAYGAWVKQRKDDGRLPFPIQTTVPPIESFSYVKNDDGLRVCVEVKEVPYFETLRAFDAGLDGDGKVIKYTGESRPEKQWSDVMSGVQTITMTEIWLPGDLAGRPDKQGECVYVLSGPGNQNGDDGEIVKRLAHPYADPYTGTLRGPYQLAFGLTTSSRDPQFQGVSMLFPYLDEYDLLNSLKTMGLNGIYWFGAWPMFKDVPTPGAGLPDAPNIGTAPDDEEMGGGAGSEVPIQPGTIFPSDIQAIDAPRLGFDLHKFMADVQQDLQSALPDVLLGALNDESGYAVNQAQHLASLYFDPIVDNAEAAFARMMAFQLYLVDQVIGEGVPVHNTKKLNGTRGGATPAERRLTVGPDEIQGVYDVDVKLTPKTPSNDALEVKRIGDELALGLMSLKEAREERGRNSDQVKEERFDEEVEKAMLPEAIQRTKQEISTLDAEALVGAEQGGLGSLVGTGTADMLGPAGEVYQPGVNMPEGAPVPSGARGGGNPTGTAVQPNQRPGYALPDQAVEQP